MAVNLTINIQEYVPLAPLTTLGVGGPARFFVEARSIEDVREALAFARSRSLPLFILGGGSNLVISDEGFDGLVLKIAISEIEQESDGDVRLFIAGAGEDWDGFVRDVVDAGCAGVECLSGIPGTVGGTPVQNVGAYGQEVSETIYAVEAVEIETGHIRTFSNTECDFSYRTSRFNSTERGAWIITRVVYAMQPGLPKLAYADLKKHFAERDGTPTLAEVRDAVISIRKLKGMVLDPSDPDSRSAGSFFKNPIVTGTQFEELAKRASARGLTIPSYPALDAQRKVSAAWLIEQAGFPKGYTKGRAAVSSKHSLAIVNRGDATASDIIALKNEIQAAVKQQFGIELRPEPVFLGFARSV